MAESTEQCKRMQLDVYNRIKREHQSTKKKKAIIARLKLDKQFMEQIREAGLRLDIPLVKAAIQYKTSARST